MKPVWRYRLEQPFSTHHPALSGVSFLCDWGQIEHGRLTIPSGYRWDGCSPKREVFGVIVGTPDGGRINESKQCFDMVSGVYGWRATGKASLVHDFLCQYRKQLPITKAQSVEIFGDLLGDWRFKSLYVWAVNHYGPQDFAQ